MSDKKVAWLWGYVKYNEKEPLGYIISLGGILLNIRFMREKNSWVCTRRNNGSLIFSFTDLVSIIKELGKSEDVAWMFGYTMPRTYSPNSTLLIPATVTGATAKDIPTFNDFSSEIKMSWFSGLNSDGEACIVSVKDNKVKTSFVTVTEALENRAGKYINIIGQDNKILLRAKNMRNIVNNNVVYPNPLMILASYYESISKNKEKSGIKSVEAYKSAFIDKIELKNDTSNGRYQLLKYYGHFGKYKSSIAVVDMLMAHNNRAKGSDTQWMHKHSLLNTFNTAFDFDKKSDKSHQGVLLRYLRYFDGYQLLNTYAMNDVRSTYTNWLGNAFNVTRTKIAKTARHDEEHGLGYGRVLRVPREVLDVIRKFDNQIHDVCREISEEDCEYMVRDIQKVVKTIIKTGNLAYINVMNTFVEYPETRAETVLNAVLALHDIPVDWNKNATMRTIRYAVRDTEDNTREFKDFLKTLLFLISACATCLEGRGKDGCSITGWRMKDAVWCIYKSLECESISGEDYDPYRLIEMATVFDDDPYEGVVGMFSEQIYTVLCEFLCEIITHITKKTLSERQTPTRMYMWFGNQLDFKDTVNYGFYTKVSTVSLIAKNFEGAELNVRACGLRDYIYYHKYRYMVGVVVKVLELSEVKDAGKYAVEIVESIGEKNKILWNTCLMLRYKYLNPEVDMSKHKTINTLFTVYNSTAFIGTDAKSTKLIAQYPEKDISVPSDKDIIGLYPIVHDKTDVTKGLDKALQTFINVAVKYCK